ncbi:MAG: hypothetical protein R3F48_14315 [Candidatus Zixiibacteriota bacterium]
MKSLMKFFIVFAFALMLGGAMTIFSPEAATACGCAHPDPFWSTGPTCYCPSGVQGNYITRCLGYNENWQPCCCITYCSACPPKFVDAPYPAIADDASGDPD